VYLDLSRVRFDASKHYSAVLLQQGRVILDSDVTEQNAILQHYLRTVVADLIGPAASPAGAAGFALAPGSAGDLTVSAGRMYVDGILAETGPGGTTYLTQPDGYIDPDKDALPSAGPYILYLRAWERSVTFCQDPDIREVALGIHGPDTTGRLQVVWQIAFWPVTETNVTQEGAVAAWEQSISTLYQPAGTLRARATQPEDSTIDICSVSPQAQYRGRENQNYRVEIFRSGVAAPAQQGPAQGGPTATYVWSREMGSVVFAIQALAGAEITLASLGRDLPSGLELGDWVEVVDDASASRVADDKAPGPFRALFQVTAIDPVNCVVTLNSDPSASIGGTGTNPALHPLLRRWDGALANVTEGGWLDLEAGVQIQFPGVTGTEPAQYRSGDYWLVPARTVLGDVIWPQDDTGPQPLPPAGIIYHYAPLAFVPPGSSDPTVVRKTFGPVA
jgi:Family of unknown function (DUF6519)